MESPRWGKDGVDAPLKNKLREQINKQVQNRSKKFTIEQANNPKNIIMNEQINKTL